MAIWIESEVCVTCDACGRTETANMTREAFVLSQRDKGWKIGKQRATCPDCQKRLEIERRTHLPTTDGEESWSAGT